MTEQPQAASTPIGTVTINEDKDGVEIRFPSKPRYAVRETLKASGWRWSGWSRCWYHRRTPDAEAFARQLIEG
jgi:hypothetical protein